MGQEVVHTSFGGNCCRRERVVTRDHDAANAHQAKLGDPLFHAALYDIFQVDDAQQALSVRHCQRRSTIPRDAIAYLLDTADLAARIANELADRFGRSLSEPPSLEIDTAHPCIGREWDKRRIVFRNVAAPEAILLFRQDYDRPAFRRLVGKT